MSHNRDSERKFTVLPRILEGDPSPDDRLGGVRGSKVTDRSVSHGSQPSQLSMEQALTAALSDASIQGAFKLIESAPSVGLVTPIDDIKLHYLTLAYKESSFHGGAGHSGGSESGMLQLKDAARTDASEYLSLNKKLRAKFIASKQPQDVQLGVAFLFKELGRVERYWRYSGDSWTPISMYPIGSLGALVVSKLYKTPISKGADRQMILTGYHTQGLYSFPNNRMDYPERLDEDRLVYLTFSASLQNQPV